MDEITVSGSDKNNETSEQQDWVCNFFAGKLKELTKELEVQKQLNALHQEELSTMTKMSLKTVNNLKKEKEKEVKELKGELKDEKDKNAKFQDLTLKNDNTIVHLKNEISMQDFLNMEKVEQLDNKIKELEEVIAAKSTEVENLKEVNQTIREQTQNLGKKMVKHIAENDYQNNLNKAQIHHLKDNYKKNVHKILKENLLLTGECSYLCEENDRLKNPQKSLEATLGNTLDLGDLGNPGYLAYSMGNI